MRTVTAAVVAIAASIGVLGTGSPVTGAGSGATPALEAVPTWVAGAPVDPADEEPVGVPEPAGGVAPARSDGRVPLVEVPAGCPAPVLPDVVFVGTVVDRDHRTVRFRIEQVRAGSVVDAAVEDLVDVRYGLDAQFLDLDGEYLVSAARHPLLDVLFSGLRDPAPVFGGDDVVGVESTDTICPELEDPVRTLFVDGTPVPTSVFAPLLDSRTRVLGAVLAPFAVAFGVVFFLAMLRLGVSGVVRGLRSAARRRRR